MSTIMLDEASFAAMISVNAFPIQQPPLPLRFGEFKPIEFDRAHMYNLAKTFRKGSFEPFNWEAMIPILLSPGDLDPACINTSIALGHRTPALVLSEAGKRRPDIIACEGYHRYCAVKCTMRNINNEINNFSSRYEHLDRRLAHDCLNRDEAAMATEESNKFWGKVQNLESTQADYKMWGVVVYDIGMCCIHDLYSMYSLEHLQTSCIKNF
jgi:hypothetical protein